MKKRILILAGGVASRMKKEADNLNVDQQLIESRYFDQRDDQRWKGR